MADRIDELWHSLYGDPAAPGRIGDIPEIVASLKSLTVASNETQKTVVSINRRLDQLPCEERLHQIDKIEKQVNSANQSILGLERWVWKLVVIAVSAGILGGGTSAFLDNVLKHFGVLGG